MKMTTQKAFLRFNALQAIERGKGPDKPYDLPWETLVLTAAMINALEPHIQAYQKARAARFKKHGGKETRTGDFARQDFTPPEGEMKFRDEEEKALETEIDVVFPTDKLDLNIQENRQPPTLLASLDGLFNSGFEVKMDDSKPKGK